MYFKAFTSKTVQLSLNIASAQPLNFNTSIISFNIHNSVFFPALRNIVFLQKIVYQGFFHQNRLLSCF